MCMNGWDSVDARVVCDQLGYFGEPTAVSGTQFGSGMLYSKGMLCRLCKCRLGSMYGNEYFTGRLNAGYYFLSTLHLLTPLSLSLSLSSSLFSSPLVPSNMRIWMDNVQCSGTEHYLSGCSFGHGTGWGQVYSSCRHHTRDAGVVCAISEYAIPVRLANGTAANEGRVGD